MRLLRSLPFVLLPALVSAQVPAHLKRVVQQLKKDIAAYGPLNAYEVDPDSIGPVHDRLVQGLLQVLNDKASTSMDLETPWTGRDIGVNHSADNRIWIFSIDQKSVGTYKPSTNIVQARDTQGNVSTSLLESDAGFGTPVPISDSAYFCEAGVKTCSDCFDLYAFYITLQGAELSMDEIMTFRGRIEDLEAFGFDPATKTFTHAYRIPSDGTDDEAGDDVAEPPRHSSGTFGLVNGRSIEVGSCTRLLLDQ